MPKNQIKSNHIRFCEKLSLQANFEADVSALVGIFYMYEVIYK
jgi:hypothetical protein